jgi:TRAP-type uncharacterized transport system substrate-binding protein
MSLFHLTPSASGGISRLVCDRIRKSPIQLAPLLLKAGLTIEQIDDRAARLSVESQIRFLELAAEALQDDFLGFHLARNFDLREIGLLYYVLASSQFLADALNKVERYSGIVNDGISLRFRSGHESAITLSYVDVERRSDRQQIEFWVTSLVRICRQLTDRRLVPSRIRVVHHREKMPSELRSFLGCEIGFGSNSDEVVFPGAVEVMPVVSADLHLNQLLIKYCEETLPYREANSVKLRSNVENAIAVLLPHGKARADEIARQLGMSHRTLARRLSSDGLTLSQILDELKVSLAKGYLKDEDLPVSQIAWLLVAHVVALIIAPPGSSIDSVEALKGRTVGVIGGEANARLVDVLSKQYGLVRAKAFRDVTLSDARQALQSKEVSAILVVIPLSEKYLSLVRGFFQQNAKTSPVLVPIDAAGAIAEAERAYESFDVPKGTLRGSPPVPDDDLTTLRASLYLVANKKLSSDLIASLTQTIMRVRRDLLVEQPIFAQITAPSTDADANVPLHPGAAAFYNGTQQSFMDEYGNWIYLAPMILGGVATVLAGAWKFLGIGQRTSEGPLDTLYALARRIRKADTEAELSDIEDEIDGVLRAERAKAASGDESAVDATTLNVAAHRLESLIHDRRAAVTEKPPTALVPREGSGRPVDAIRAT